MRLHAFWYICTIIMAEHVFAFFRFKEDINNILRIFDSYLSGCTASHTKSNYCIDIILGTVCNLEEYVEKI